VPGSMRRDRFAVHRPTGTRRVAYAESLGRLAGGRDERNGAYESRITDPLCARRATGSHSLRRAEASRRRGSCDCFGIVAAGQVEPRRRAATGMIPQIQASLLVKSLPFLDCPLRSLWPRRSSARQGEGIALTNARRAVAVGVPNVD
jgi:hypothetical protein